MDMSVEWAGRQGYNKLYLESLPELGKAISLYEKAGFKFIPAPLGNSGHFGCHIWMVKDL
jgi:putative acetyltransferase